MKNVNQYKFDVLPNSQIRVYRFNDIAITKDVGSNDFELSENVKGNLRNLRNL